MQFLLEFRFQFNLLTLVSAVGQIIANLLTRGFNSNNDYKRIIKNCYA